MCVCVCVCVCAHVHACVIIFMFLFACFRLDQRSLLHIALCLQKDVVIFELRLLNHLQ